MKNGMDYDDTKKGIDYANDTHNKNILDMIYGWET
jgi:hypothetical protein